MTEEKIHTFMHKMLVANTAPHANEFWVSSDIYLQLNTFKYLHCNIYTSELIPEDTMYLGKMFF
mgnify:CR=1 FL=1